MSIGKSLEIYIDVSNPFERDPDGSSSLVYKEGDLYYRVHPMGAAFELNPAIWKERRAISVAARRKAESILVPDPDPPKKKREPLKRSQRGWRKSQKLLRRSLFGPRTKRPS
ncbi:MAG: hypothetical protein OEY44_01890 [Candidatus Peregrinibacteria bacterium]|nr:hypothetical protein [Candidatus Peregrinibacteria bacterium]